MKILPVGADVSPTDRRTSTLKLIAAFRNFAKAHKMTVAQLIRTAPAVYGTQANRLWTLSSTDRIHDTSSLL